MSVALDIYHSGHSKTRMYNDALDSALHVQDFEGHQIIKRAVFHDESFMEFTVERYADICITIKDIKAFDTNGNFAGQRR